MTAELDRRCEVSELQAEESRILRARIEHIPPPKRPHYPPAERLAILMLRAKAGWNAAETARRFVVTPATIASWIKRLDEEGDDALERVRFEPRARMPLARGDPSMKRCRKLELRVSYLGGFRELPVVELREAA